MTIDSKPRQRLRRWNAAAKARVLAQTLTLGARVATTPVDFRKDATGLAALVSAHPQADPVSGAIYVFRSKRIDRMSPAPFRSCEKRRWNDFWLTKKRRTAGVIKRMAGP